MNAPEKKSQEKEARPSAKTVNIWQKSVARAVSPSARTADIWRRSVVKAAKLPIQEVDQQTDKESQKQYYNLKQVWPALN
jgi:hypothetical protein